MEFLDAPDTIELIRLAHEGDEVAWLKLVLQHREKLRRLAKIRLDPRLAPRLDPEDLVQEALADASGSLGAFFQESGFVCFSTWLRQRLVERVNRSHDMHLGAKKRDVARESQGLPACDTESQLGWIDCLVDSGTSPSHGLTRDEANHLIREALGELREIDREVLIMYFFEQLNLGEIGSIVDLSANSVVKRLSRAITHLGKALRHAYPEWYHVFELKAERHT